MTDEELLAGFENGSLQQFHHADHIHVAWLYLWRYPTAEALWRFTESLKRFAAAKGAPGLYHETITWAYLFLINERRLRTPELRDWPAFAEAHRDLLQWKPGLLDRYYEAETLGTALAKESFLMPNRCGVVELGHEDLAGRTDDDCRRVRRVECA